MAIEGHFDDFDKKAFEEERDEDSEIDGVLDVFDRHSSDPHFKDIKIEKDLTPFELEAAKKFNEGKLKEEEITRMLEQVGELGEHNPRYAFLAGLKNKILSLDAWRRLDERKRRSEGRE